MNNRGGRRPGAGRPVGSKNQRTQEIAHAAAEAGITPIEVMLVTVRGAWAQGTPDAKREAAEIAKDAAPYIHPRLASIDQTVSEDRPFALLVEPCLDAEEWEASASSPRRQVIRLNSYRINHWRVPQVDF